MPGTFNMVQPMWGFFLLWGCAADAVTLVEVAAAVKCFIIFFGNLLWNFITRRLFLIASQPWTGDLLACQPQLHLDVVLHLNSQPFSISQVFHIPKTILAISPPLASQAHNQPQGQPASRPRFPQQQCSCRAPPRGQTRHAGRRNSARSKATSRPRRSGESPLWKAQRHRWTCFKI